MLNPSDVYTKESNFQAILQLRPFNHEIDMFIKKQIAKRNDCFINKEEKKKYGIDYYVSNQRFARALGKKLKDTFKGELKSTRSLFSFDRHQGKSVYRVTVCFRLAETGKPL
ncbi:MAG: NMD3-related protein [Nanoarchaeota archaeon]